MEIQIMMDCPVPDLDEQKVKLKVKRVLKDLGCHDKELSILFTDDKHMAALNRQYRNKEGATDVLSFAMMEDVLEDKTEAFFEPMMLGDVVISVDTAQRDAEEMGEPFERTVDRLLIHGILHLLGYDHEKSQMEAVRMIEAEKRLLAEIQTRYL